MHVPLLSGQLEPADYTDVVAVPHPPLPDGHAVRQRIAVGQLNLLADLSGFRIMFEESVQVRIRNPKKLAFPADAMRAVARGGKFHFHGPRFWIYPIDLARGRNSEPQLPVLPLQPICACAKSFLADPLASFKSSSLLPPPLTPPIP